MAAIPALGFSNESRATGSALVSIESRKIGLGISGTFKIELDVKFNPVIDEYPVGTIKIVTGLSDTVNGTFKTENIDLINSHGKHNPTIFLTGRMAEDLANYKGCRYWLMIANNKTLEMPRSFDIISFAIHDAKGELVAYGTGPVIEGDISVNRI